ncbi:MAG TPA: c-type cytochrome [Gemmatimonadales bacterium]|nr:c-type cytochrome [Gemmatimonadales bacterium]
MWMINLRVLLVAALVIGFYTTVAHVIPQLESEVPEALDLSGGASPEALASAGERIYNGAGGCTACHGLGTRAPNLLTDHGGEGPIGARCGTRGKDCKAYLYESMTSPGAFLVPGFENIMPDMRRQIAEDQIWAVIAYLQSLGGEITVTASDLPAPVSGNTGGAATGPAPTATTDPEALLTEKGCIGCHILNGTGGPVGPPFDGMGRRLRADQIRRSILQPNADTAKGYEKMAGTMPPNFGQLLSAQQLEAIVGFLANRQ